MATHNLIVVYDLNKPGQDYSSLFAAIRRLGTAVKFQLSAWYVASDVPPDKAADFLRQYMDNSDSLFVVDAVSNEAAWYGLTEAQSAAIQRNWVQRPAAGYRYAG